VLLHFEDWRGGGKLIAAALNKEEQGAEMKEVRGRKGGRQGGKGAGRHTHTVNKWQRPGNVAPGPQQLQQRQQQRRQPPT
jgi:hypothetical protein